jgi:hypothetical protein
MAQMDNLALPALKVMAEVKEHRLWLKIFNLRLLSVHQESFFDLVLMTARVTLWRSMDSYTMMRCGAVFKSAV